MAQLLIARGLKMMFLRVNSLSNHQLRSPRIHPSTLVPLSALLVFTKFMTTGANLKVLAASGDGGKAIHFVVIRSLTTLSLPRSQIGFSPGVYGKIHFALVIALLTFENSLGAGAPSWRRRPWEILR
jgi:hypothetical protein